MGNLINGLFGNFHGKIGNLVGYTLNGKHVIRTIGKTSKPPTLPKLANYEGMTVVNRFLKASIGFIKPGFRLAVAGTAKNAYNEAVSYNKKNALQGQYPHISMDYSKAKVSMGTLPKAEKPGILKTDNGVEFNWEVPSDMPGERKIDRVMLFLYYPKANKVTYILSGAQRHSGKEVMTIDSNLQDQYAEAYISFIKDDASEISDSVYIGSLDKNTTETIDKQSKKEHTIQNPSSTKKVIHSKKNSGKTNVGQRLTQFYKHYPKKSNRIYTPPS